MIKYAKLTLGIGTVSILGISMVSLTTTSNIETVVAEVKLPNSTANIVTVEPYKEEPVIVNNAANLKVNMESDIGCLTSNVYFESANQSDIGKTAVAYATINRANKYGNDGVCDAVKNSKYNTDGTQKVNYCHFSWYCNGNPIKVVNDDNQSQTAWDKSYTISKKALNSNIKNPIGQRDHYCTLSVEKHTSWVKYMKKNTRLVIGDHVFYEADPKKFEAAWKKRLEKKTTV